MNRYPISPFELNIIKLELEKCQRDKRDLSKQLGELMSRSPTFPSRTPGYSITETDIMVLERKIEKYYNIINSTITIQGINELADDRITVYSRVVAEDENGELNRYYICHLDISSNLENAVAVTPGSPIGKALIGKMCEDVIKIVLPKGKIKLTIISHEKILKN